MRKVYRFLGEVVINMIAALGHSLVQRLTSFPGGIYLLWVLVYAAALVWQVISFYDETKLRRLMLVLGLLGSIFISEWILVGIFCLPILAYLDEIYK